MKRATTPALAIAALTLLLAGVAVLAKSIACDSGKCVGTERRDLITGADTIAGRDGNDVIVGDPKSFDTPAGNDVIRGGAGNDQIGDAFGANPDDDQIFGGKGDDIIQSLDFDDSVDLVDRGPGQDFARADPSDQLENCEEIDIPV